MSFSDNFIAIMDELGKRLGIAIDWTSANVIPYLQDLATRLIKYKIAIGILYMIIPIVFTAIFAVLTKIFHKKAMALPETMKEQGWSYCYKPYDESCLSTWFAYISWVCLVISAIVTISVIGVQTLNIIQAITFPEKTIFEYISSLLNNGQA